MGFNIVGLSRNGNPSVRYTGYFYILGCIYLGRWVSRKFWSHHNPNTSFFLYSVISWLGILLGWWCIIKLFFAPHAGFLELSISAGSFFSMAFIGGILVKMVRMSIQSQLQEAQSIAEHTRSELGILQSQLSPHFLFNTLNNLYGISISQHEKIPPLLLKLSDLLRYSVYESKELLVPLKDEITYIRNYIEFEKLRIGERLTLNTDLDSVADHQVKIAPMLFIVFIENAFKHSKNTPEEKIFIDISLRVNNDSVLFSVKNSYHKAIDNHNIQLKNSGLGLENVTKRLELQYPHKYILKTEDDGEIYSINLELKT